MFSVFCGVPVVW